MCVIILWSEYLKKICLCRQINANALVMQWNHWLKVAIDRNYKSIFWLKIFLAQIIQDKLCLVQPSFLAGQIAKILNCSVKYQTGGNLICQCRKVCWKIDWWLAFHWYMWIFNFFCYYVKCDDVMFLCNFHSSTQCAHVCLLQTFGSSEEVLSCCLCYCSFLCWSNTG